MGRFNRKLEEIASDSKMLKKKLYVCITPFFPDKDAVYGSYIYDQIKAISRNSEFKVVVLRPKPLLNKAESYEYDGIKVLLFPALFMPSYFFNGLTNPYNKRVFISSLKLHGIDIGDIGIVHCHTASFACFGIAIKKINPHAKVLLQHHDPDPYQIVNGKFAGFLPNLLYRTAVNMSNFKKIDCHICISKFVEKNLLSFPNIDSNIVYEPYINKLKKIGSVKFSTSGFKTYVLYNGVDTDIFKPLSINKSNDAFTIGCIANYIDWKDQISLLKAINLISQKEQIPNLKVKLIGHGPLEESLHQYAISHNLEGIVQFNDEIDHSKLPDFYNSLDLFVLPSYFEGFGCVYTEAAACGVPFIMCKGQGASEYIPASEAEKWLIDKGDFESLANKIYNYYLYRYNQILSKTFNINELIKEYLRAIIY